MNTSEHIDKLGAWASITCAVHCMVTPILFAALPVLGLRWLDNPWVDTIFLVAATIFALIAHPKGYKQHCRWEPALLAISGIVGIVLALVLCGDKPFHHYIFALGGTLVAVSHILNQRFCRKCHDCCEG